MKLVKKELIENYSVVKVFGFELTDQIKDETVGLLPFNNDYYKLPSSYNINNKITRIHLDNSNSIFYQNEYLILAYSTYFNNLPIKNVKVTTYEKFELDFTFHENPYLNNIYDPIIVDGYPDNYNKELANVR